MVRLSRAAQSLWAKKSSDGNLLWLPLWVHMVDSAAAAKMLWHRWLPQGAKRAIHAEVMDEDLAEQLFVFLAAAHDIGKATPFFQAKPSRPICPDLDSRIIENLTTVGLPMIHYSAFSSSKTPHALATQVLLEQAGCNRNTAVILGGHHGKPASSTMLSSGSIDSYSFNYHLEKEGKLAWTQVQQELIAYATDLAGFSSLKDIPIPNVPGQVLLTGLLIMTDWVASNTHFFPLIRIEDSQNSVGSQRGKYAWKQFGLNLPWEPKNTWMSTDLYHRRFCFSMPNRIQTAVAEAIKHIKKPGIMILEAPMGSGKTEAALVAAESFAYLSKRSGVFFALPTQATSDGIFPRMLNWIESLESESEQNIILAHGKAQYHKEFQGLKFLQGSANISEDDRCGVYVHEWFEGKKKSLLADFVVGTIDQLLLAALKQKHIMLRHLGLANKVVIIDECHAYDAYMGHYLDMALRWLGAYHVPVIVLSATLPAQRREAVLNAYLNKTTHQPVNNPLAKCRPSPKQQSEFVLNRNYPLITYTDGQGVKQTAITFDKSHRVYLEPLAEDALVEKLDVLLSRGGCAGVIVNTVKRAQDITQVLRDNFGHDAVRLIHSRFLAPDRTEKEREILLELGKPGQSHRPTKRVLVGTQVLEQSLDIDFDLLVTDLCPMDLLLQRIGRLHRHERPRPENLNQATCLIMGLSSEELDSGSKRIYGEYLLMRTKELLPKQLILPQDIPNLVQDVYDETVPLPHEPPGYQEAKTRWVKLLQTKESRADVFRICPPWHDLRLNISDWLDKDVSDHHGEAAVRDSDESIEILLIQEREGRLQILGKEDGLELIPSIVPDSVVAEALATQRIRLPNSLCGPWIIDRTIAELERITAERLFTWQDSPWLRGELFLILDENYSAHLSGYLLSYDSCYGLHYEKEVESHGE